MTGRSKGLYVHDTAGAQWLHFYYSINIKDYIIGSGFMSKYMLGE